MARRPIFAAILAAVFSAISCAAQQRIPSVPTESLAGTPVALPGEHHPTLLILGFSRKSKAATADWQKRASTLSIPVYTLPILADVPRLFRGAVLHAIRSEVPPAVQPHLVPIFDHEAEWKQAAGFSQPDDAYILLVDARGQILWRTEGPITEARLADLQAHLKSP